MISIEQQISHIETEINLLSDTYDRVQDAACKPIILQWMKDKMVERSHKMIELHSCKTVDTTEDEVKGE
jgi:hypothetical protein